VPQGIYPFYDRIAAVFPRDMVCLGNICINTLHKGDNDEDDDNIIIIIKTVCAR
jgi:hypothetical protein